MLLTIDGGTTNTRFRLMDGRRVLAERKLTIGAGGRDGARALAAAVRRKISDIMVECGVPQCSVEGIAASGMICSELGLHDTGYVKTPVTAGELVSRAKYVRLPEISLLPFLFIPGVMTGNTLETMDVMRGEESEYFGLTGALGYKGSLLAVLPGSHCKIIRGREDRIETFQTTMSGEMLRALSENTILRHSVRLNPQFDITYLFEGYRYAVRLGLPAALFKVRVADKFRRLTDEQKSAFFTGMLLEGDVRTVLAAEACDAVVVGGSDPLRSELYALLCEFSDRHIVLADAQSAAYAASYAAAVFWRLRKR